MRCVDLFAGVGGIRLGFENAGFSTVFSNDFEPACKETFDLNFNESPLIIKDINKVDNNSIPDFDILLGGFPCQPFSIAGYRQGFKDSKGRGLLIIKMNKLHLTYYFFVNSKKSFGLTILIPLYSLSFNICLS